MLYLYEDSSTQETYYDILSVGVNATYDEIRARYKASLLNSHPDKLNTKQELGHHLEAHERFLKIQKAWEVLGDADSRAIYDRELKAVRPEQVFLDEVKLEDMNLNGLGNVVELVYPCRCGDNFSITSDELKEMGFLLDGDKGLGVHGANMAPVSITIPCSSCSLKVCLTMNGNC